MKSIYLVVFSILLLSCEKQISNCENIQKARASSNKNVTIGDSILLHTQEVGGLRVYTWRGPNNFLSYEPRNIIYDAELKNEGWYRLSISNSECVTKVDSVYVDIKLKQGNPPCTITNNSSTFNNLPGHTYTSIKKLYDASTQFLTLRGGGTFTLDVKFHHYWKTKEPEDGIYETVNVPSFSIDGNYNKVYINTIVSSVHFASHEGQLVYVSHVNGKLQVRFCNLSMGGYNGMSFTTIASGNLIEL